MAHIVHLSIPPALLLAFFMTKRQRFKVALTLVLFLYVMIIVIFGGRTIRTLAWEGYVQGKSQEYAEGLITMSNEFTLVRLYASTGVLGLLLIGLSGGASRRSRSHEDPPTDGAKVLQHPPPRR